MSKKYIEKSKAGIYKIVSAINNKCYIGSAIKVNHRKNMHIHLIRNNRHSNIFLQIDYNLYGEANFTFEVIEYCDCELVDLLIKEQYYLDTIPLLYNINKRAITQRRKNKLKKSKNVK